MPRKGFKKCSIDGCQGNVVARDLCDLHYRRDLHHGDVEQGRPVDWGTRENHPLYPAWYRVRRDKSVSEKEWWDFWQFVRDVGDRPSEKHRLHRLDDSKPWGPKNFFWREKIYIKKSDETRKEYQRRSMREYREKNPQYFRDKDLRRYFGITVEQYESMWREQDGKCAICRKSNSVIDNRTGKLRMLAVDHCHKSGHVRKLLCQQCNQGLGNFRDDALLLRAAADYLEA